MQRKQVKKQIDHFIYYFEEQLLRFKFLSKKTSHHPNAKNIHLLRSLVRRLRVSLWVMENESLEKKLKKLQNALGKVREQDVLMEKANDLNLSSSKLEERRYHRVHGLKPLLKKEQRRKIMKPLYEIAHSLHKHPFLKLDDRFFMLKCHAISWVHRTISDEELHQFRISLKKFRYASEAFGKDTRTLERLIDLLGEAHDLQELIVNFKDSSRFLKHQPQILQKEKVLKKQAKALARKYFLK